ncbi:hypothetical protein D3C87_189470 [compost metagenome]
MKECTPQSLKYYFEEIQKWVQKTGKEVVLPTAIAEDGQVYNSGWWFKTNEVHSFYKTGLTDSEKGFFSLPKTEHSKLFEIKDFTFAILICFEAEHQPWTYFRPNEVDAILWPGYWGWDLESKWTAEKEAGKPNEIFNNVNQWKRPVLQSNFAYNDLEGHQGAGPEGLSFIINSDNKLLYRGAHQKADGLLIELTKKEGLTTISNYKVLT